MLMIRFQRIGRTNDPAFRIVVLEKERAAKAGNIVEQLGTYNPRNHALTLNDERVKYWISVGAKPTGSIHNLLITRGVISGKKVNVLPRKTPLKPAASSEASGPDEQSPEQTVVATEGEVAAPTSEVGEPTESVGSEAEPAPEEAPTPTETPTV